MSVEFEVNCCCINLNTDSAPLSVSSSFSMAEITLDLVCLNRCKQCIQKNKTLKSDL